MSNRLKHITKKRTLRKARVRSRVIGSSERPRMTVSITNRHVGIQLIDDSIHKTLVGVTTVGKKSVKGTMTDKAVWAGKEIAKLAKAKKITSVSLDRGSKLYHGRIKALADAARESGLEF